jgi:hypothetical protein
VGGKPIVDCHPPPAPKEYKMSNHQSGSKAITGLVMIFVVLLALLVTMFLVAAISVA